MIHYKWKIALQFWGLNFFQQVYNSRNRQSLQAHTVIMYELEDSQFWLAMKRFSDYAWNLTQLRKSDIQPRKREN